MKKVFLLAALFACYGSLYGQDYARGVVYEDLNGNGQRDKREKGIAGVSVSNGVQVVQTDATGAYTIAVQSDNIIFVIKPAGYQVPLGADSMPNFYYIHKPIGSPQLKYEGSPATGKLPKAVDFALRKSENQEHTFTAFVFGDPQAYTLAEIDFFKRGVIDEAKTRSGVSFGISLGDLVGDDLNLHPAYKKAVSALGLPWYNVMGNHDMNYDVLVDSLSDETYERNFGPNTFSFNYGKAHFIVLDNILYPNPNTGKGYLGGLRPDQLDFVENDLKYVPKDHLIVLAFHIPMDPENHQQNFRAADRQRLFDLLADYPNTVSLSAHTHYQQQNFYGPQHGWKQSQPHHEYNVGTTSGDWYSGRLSSQGVPVSTMRDGTPKGYALLKVDSNSYVFDYKVVGQSEDYKIQLFGPSVVAKKHVQRYPVYANFFMGTAQDTVEYRIGQGKWKAMNYVVQEDPAYVQELLAYDSADALREGRRPSDPTKSKHLWRLKLSKLEAGEHVLTVRVKDMYQRVFETSKKITVLP